MLRYFYNSQEISSPICQSYMLHGIISDAIKLLNAELIEIDASNYKTDWIAPYLKDFAKKHGVPFATLMKTLRSVMSGVKVNIYITSELIFIVGKNICIIYNINIS